MSALLHLDAHWRDEGGSTTVYAFDEATSEFRALRLKPEADVLLLWRWTLAQPAARLSPTYMRSPESASLGPSQVGPRPLWRR